MADTNLKVRIETEPSDGFLLNEKLMFAVVGILSAALVFVVSRHIYDRWYFRRLRSREMELHRGRMAGPRIHNVIYDTNAPHHIADRGLDRAVLSSLPVFLYSGEVPPPTQGCTVCLSEFERDDIIRLLPKCNHSFHVDCIDMWFHSHSTCPLCRSRVERVAEPVQNRGKPGSSSGNGGGPATCEGDQARNGGTAAATDGETTMSPLPPGQGMRFSRSRLMYLKRILSMNRKAADGGTTVDGGSCVDIECGELTRDESNNSHTPGG